MGAAALQRPAGHHVLHPAPGTFAAPGTYLVICNIRSHFAGSDMYGWVVVE